MATYYWVTGTGTWSTTGNTHFATSSGGTPTLSNPTTGDTVNFDANSGVAGASYTVTVNTTATVTTVNLANPSAGTASFTLGADFTNTGTFTFTSGAITLSNLKLSCGAFSSNNANTRSIAFGTGNITCSGTGTVWRTDVITGFSYTGTSTVNLTDSSSTLRSIIQGAGTAAQAVSFYIKAGTGQINLTTTSGVFKDIDCTGSTVSLNIGSSIALYGNLVLTNSSASTAYFSNDSGNGLAITNTLLTTGKIVSIVNAPNSLNVSTGSSKKMAQRR